MNLKETTVNIVSEGSRIEGDIRFDRVTRVHGTLVGKVSAAKGGTLILSETAVVEGDIDADELLIDGFVRGDVTAGTRVVVSRTGRVIGDIRAPSLQLEFGSYFEGRCRMEGVAGSVAPPAITSDPAPKPA